MFSLMDLGTFSLVLCQKPSTVDLDPGAGDVGFVA